MTTIEWTHAPGYRGASWNPTVGCTRVSAGCDNCYAFSLHDRRYAGNLAFARRSGSERPRDDLERGAVRIKSAEWVGQKRGLTMARQYDLPFSKVQLLPERLELPTHTRTPTCYFVDSMADLFHEDVPDEYLDRVWDVMTIAVRHRFLVLTKRPERMAEWTRSRYGRHVSAQSALEAHVPHNIWLGTSVEDQDHAEDRVPQLLAAPARTRFLSVEPLLGPLTLTKYLDATRRPWHGAVYGGRVDWVIVGGESGARARPFNIQWARTLRNECRDHGVSFFMKQMGSNARYMGYTQMGIVPELLPERSIRESHGREMDEWPEDLRVRTWPS